MCVYVCVCACVFVCVSFDVRVCECVFVCVCAKNVLITVSSMKDWSYSYEWDIDYTMIMCVCAKNVLIFYFLLKYNQIILIIR